jgi:hypothetical protein
MGRDFILSERISIRVLRTSLKTAPKRGSQWPPRNKHQSSRPLLNTVARKLGHAAGQLTKVTQELTKNLSALPESVATKVHKAVNTGALPDRPRIQTRRRAKKTRKAVRHYKAR